MTYRVSALIFNITCDFGWENFIYNSTLVVKNWLTWLRNVINYDDKLTKNTL